MYQAITGQFLNVAQKFFLFVIGFYCPKVKQWKWNIRFHKWFYGGLTICLSFFFDSFFLIIPFQNCVSELRATLHKLQEQITVEKKKNFLSAPSPTSWPSLILLLVYLKSCLSSHPPKKRCINKKSTKIKDWVNLQLQFLR